MGMRDKKRNQKRVLARRTAAPRAGEGKDFLVRGSPTPLLGFRGMGEISSFFFFANATHSRAGCASRHLGDIFETGLIILGLFLFCFEFLPVTNDGSRLLVDPFI